ncbi:MAG TPA: hypothetical protein VM324_16035 [Egibacteraceae bacterium]|nr:hypothetical protein [Egibacteraceae bacterium]
MPVRLAGESGVVGGLEALAFGLLTCMIGGLLIANTWAVVDAKFTTAAAAREAARAYATAPDAATAEDAAVAAAHEVIRGYGRSVERFTLPPPAGDPFGRCVRATFTASYDVPTITLPFIGGFAAPTITVNATHSEIVDPYRSGLDVDRGVACETAWGG